MKTILSLTRFLALLSLWMALPSCAWFKQCAQPEHRNDVGCAIVQGVIDCTESAVQVVIPQFKPLVQQLIAEATGQDGTIDWKKVEAGLASLGLKDGGCIFADIEKDFVLASVNPAASVSSVARMTARSYHEGFTSMRAARWGNAKFKVKKPDGSTMLL